MPIDILHYKVRTSKLGWDLHCHQQPCWASGRRYMVQVVEHFRKPMDLRHRMYLEIRPCPTVRSLSEAPFQYNT